LRSARLAGAAHHPEPHPRLGQLTAIAGGTHVAHDARGNITSIPKPGAEGSADYTATYDAWNRLVKLADGGTVLGEYRYDGLNRRIRKVSAYTGGTCAAAEYYYNSWSQRYIDARSCGTGMRPRAGTSAAGRPRPEVEAVHTMVARPLGAAPSPHGVAGPVAAPTTAFRSAWTSALRGPSPAPLIADTT
jgi:hypothetical protein